MKKIWITFFLLAAVCLIVGASFHGYRIHPENVEKYNIGVKMGITMISGFGVFLVAGLVVLIIDKRRKMKKK